jgi:hypothetical protein
MTDRNISYTRYGSEDYEHQQPDSARTNDRTNERSYEQSYKDPSLNIIRYSKNPVEKTLDNLSYAINPGNKVIGLIIIKNDSKNGVIKLNLNSIPNTAGLTAAKTLTLIHDYCNPKNEVNEHDIFNTDRIKELKSDRDRYRSERDSLREKNEKLQLELSILRNNIQPSYVRYVNPPQPIYIQQDYDNFMNNVGNPFYDNATLEDYNVQNTQKRRRMN